MPDGGGMKSCRLQAIPCQGTQKIEAGYKPKHTTEPTNGSSAQLTPYWEYCLLPAGVY